MTRTDFINALRRALADQQPPVSLDLAANLVARYDRRFADGLAAGGSEADIAAALGDPDQIAATLNAPSAAGGAGPATGPAPGPGPGATFHASAAPAPASEGTTQGPGNAGSGAQAKAAGHLKAAHQQTNPAKVARTLVTAVGLGIFNLFMVVPAFVYAALLACMYAAALSFYIAGIAISASGLAGANELVLYGPLSHVAEDLSRDWYRAHRQPTETKILIGAAGIDVHQEATTDGSTTVTVGNAEKSLKKALGDHPDVLLRAEQLAGSKVHISTGNSDDSRTTQAVFGIFMVLGAILLFLVDLVITRYTLIGIKRYAQMNWSLLQGH